jgi:tRNA-2-methylthio-N6-dimethylallyladenosine synthase
MEELVLDKKHDEARQGEAFAPFELDANNYNRRFYI